MRKGLGDTRWMLPHPANLARNSAMRNHPAYEQPRGTGMTRYDHLTTDRAIIAAIYDSTRLDQQALQHRLPYLYEYLATNQQTLDIERVAELWTKAAPANISRVREDLPTIARNLDRATAEVQITALRAAALLAAGERHPTDRCPRCQHTAAFHDLTRCIYLQGDTDCTCTGWPDPTPPCLPGQHNIETLLEMGNPDPVLTYCTTCGHEGELT